jgi:hypothetical protein
VTMANLIKAAEGVEANRDQRSDLKSFSLLKGIDKEPDTRVRRSSGKNTRSNLW